MQQTPARDNVNLDLLALIPPATRRVVEIGCANGALARAWRAQQPSSEFIGIDIDAEYVARATPHCTRAFAADIERVADLREQAEAAQDRLRRLLAVFRSSEQVRNATIQQWQQLGRRSLFDVMDAEAEHYALRVAYVNALFDLQKLNANLLALERGVGEWLK